MKYLKKFNESSENELDIEYIESCFREVIEDDNFRCEYSYKKSVNYRLVISTWLKSSIGFDIDKPFNQWYYNPSEYNSNDTEITEFFENWLKISQRVDSSINRLLDEYPEYEIKKTLTKSPSLEINIKLNKL